MKKVFVSFILIVVFCSSGVAQTNNLSDEELDAFKAQILQRIEAFQMGLEMIGDKNQPSEIKEQYIKESIPEMFLGNGDPWIDPKGGRHDAVKMQVSSIKNDGTIAIRPVYLKKYLINLRDLIYTKVEIKKAQTCRVSNLYKVDYNKYVGTCTYYQSFLGKKGDVIVVKDFTQKDVDVYIQRVEDGRIGTYWDVKFGDINVTETKKM